MADITLNPAQVSNFPYYLARHPSDSLWKALKVSLSYSLAVARQSLKDLLISMPPRNTIKMQKAIRFFSARICQILTHRDGLATCYPDLYIDWSR